MRARAPGDLEATPIRLGLRENWRQFALLMLINGFVGAMVGIERSVLPLLAEEVFGLSSRTLILSFIAGFGLVKALSNLLAGRLSDRWGRRRVLIWGWLFGLPVPLILIFAPSWGWVVFANLLLGVNQGLCWSTTVIMKIDLVGPRKRGLAMGFNEAAGYLAVSAAALAAGYLAATYSLRPEPFYLGLAFATAGLLLSLGFVRESQGHAREEGSLAADLELGNPGGAAPGARRPAPSFGRVFGIVSWRDRSLFATSQAGLVNNLNDGLAWGLLPLFFSARGASLKEIAWLAAIYPAVWGLAQLGTGALSDRLGRKWPIAAGMWLQAGAIVVLLFGGSFGPWVAGAVLLGLGTAMVYPTLLAAVADRAHPDWRASAVGVYRLWRDAGYIVGALLAGALADLGGFGWALGGVGALTFASGLVVVLSMRETLGAAWIDLAADPGTGGEARPERMAA